MNQPSEDIWIDKKIFGELMEYREMKNIQEVGGVPAIMTYLRTSPQGLDPKNPMIENRLYLFDFKKKCFLNLKILIFIFFE